MTLNGVITVTLRYFTKFGKSAFQHINASARIEFIDIAVVYDVVVNTIQYNTMSISRAP